MILGNENEKYLEVRMLHAFNGDSFLVKFMGSDNKIRNILIDTGTHLTYMASLKAQIKDIKEHDEILDLVIITHSDEDHIGGLLSWISCFEDQPKNHPNPNELIDTIWFNSATTPFKPMVPSNDTNISARDGAKLEDYLNNYNIIWENCITSETKLPEIFDECIHLEILSPTIRRFKKSKEKAILDIKDQVFQNNKLHNKHKQIESLENLLKKNIERRTDQNIFNGGSIAFLLTIHGKRMVFLADAWENVIYDSLRERSPLQLDMIKVSHHGSIKNSSKRLFDLIRCDHFFISAKWEKHWHPDKETIALILNSLPPNSGKNIYLSYTKGEENCLTRDDLDQAISLKAQFFYMNDGESKNNYISWGDSRECLPSTSIEDGAYLSNRSTLTCDSISEAEGNNDQLKTTLTKDQKKIDLKYNAVLIEAEYNSETIKSTGTIIKSPENKNNAFVVTARHCLERDSKTGSYGPKIRTYLSGLKIEIGDPVDCYENFDPVHFASDADIAVYQIVNIKQDIYSEIGEISLLDIDPMELNENMSFVFKGFPNYKSKNKTGEQGHVVYGRYTDSKQDKIEMASKDNINVPAGHIAYDFLKGLSGAGVCVTIGNMIGVVTELPTRDALFNRIIFQPLNLIYDILDKIGLKLKKAEDDFIKFHQADIEARMNESLAFDPDVTLFETYVPPYVEIENKYKDSSTIVQNDKPLKIDNFIAWHNDNSPNSNLIMFLGQSGSGKSSAALSILHYLFNYSPKHASENTIRNGDRTHREWTGLYYDFKKISEWNKNDSVFAILQCENSKLNQSFLDKNSVFIVLDGVDERDQSGDVSPLALKFIQSLVEMQTKGSLKVLLTCRNDFITPDSDLHNCHRTMYTMQPYEKETKEKWIRKYLELKTKKSDNLARLNDQQISEIAKDKATGSPFLLGVITLLEINGETIDSSSKANKFRNVLVMTHKRCYKIKSTIATINVNKLLRLLELIAFIRTQANEKANSCNIAKYFNDSSIFASSKELKDYIKHTKHGIFTSSRNNEIFFQHKFIQDWLAASYICSQLESLARQFVAHVDSLKDVNEAFDNLFSNSKIDFDSHYANFVDLLEEYNCEYIHKLATSFIKSELETQYFMKKFASKHKYPSRAEANAIAAALYVASASLEALSIKPRTDSELDYCNYLEKIKVLAPKHTKAQHNMTKGTYTNIHLFASDEKESTNNETFAKLIYFFNSIEVGLFRKYYFPLKHISLEKAKLIGADLWKANLKQASLQDSNLYQANLTKAELNDADLTNAELNEACLRDAILTGAYLSGTNLESANFTRADLTNADFSGAILNGTNFSEVTLCDTKFSKDQDWNSCKWKNARILRFSDASIEFEAWARQHPDITISDSKIP